MRMQSLLGCELHACVVVIAYGVSATMASGRSILASFAASSRSLVATVVPFSDAALSSCFILRRWRLWAFRAIASAHISSSV